MQGMEPLPGYEPEEEQFAQVNLHQQLTIMILLIMNTLLVAGLVVVLLRPAKPPAVVVVNQKGEPVGMVQPVQGPDSLPAAYTKYMIEQFIHNAKGVASNSEEEKELLNNAYAFVTAQARKELDDYYHDGSHYPFDIQQKGWVEVTMLRPPLLQNPGTYQVDWQETRHEYQSDVQNSTVWRATIGVTSGGSTARNPVGLYISTIDWAPEVH